MTKIWRLLVLALVAAMLVACGTRTENPEPTKPNPTDPSGADKVKPEDLKGDKVVFQDGAYVVEAGAKLKFGADSDALGEAIVALWDKTHPEAKGAVEYVNNGAAGSADKLPTEQGESPDVLMVIDGEVPRNATHALALEENLVKLVKENSIESFYNAGNGTGATIYAPITYDGMAFVWNKTMLTELGLDTTDANNDNLPDAFDTWEEIFALAESYKGNRPTVTAAVTKMEKDADGNDVRVITDEKTESKLNVIFPFSMTEAWSNYFALSAGGWKLFGADKDPLKPGYDTPEFKKGLEFIVAARDAHVSVEANGEVTPGSSMGWRWDDVLNGVNLAPFGLVGTWMDVTGMAADTGNEYIISKLPTWEGRETTPFVKTKGYVINTYTQYRSASMELMRLLYSKEGLQAMVDNSSYAPSLVEGSALTPNLDNAPVQKQFMSAFEFNFPEPAIKFTTGDGAMDKVFYADGFVKDLAPLLWNQEKTADQVVADLVELTNAVLETQK